MILEILSTVRLIIGCIIAAFLIKTFLLKPVHVRGDSMYPTLQNNDIGVSNVLGILTGNVERFDVVVVNDPNSDSLIVKRVIGLPGERLEYKDGKLYIDDKYVKEPFLDEAYIKEATKDRTYFTDNVPAIVLGNDEYFVVGDNRVNSLDSRVNGPVKGSDIVSKDVYVLFPFSRIGMISNGNK